MADLKKRVIVWDHTHPEKLKTHGLTLNDFMRSEDKLRKLREIVGYFSENEFNEAIEAFLECHDATKHRQIAQPHESSEIQSQIPPSSTSKAPFQQQPSSIIPKKRAALAQSQRSDNEINRPVVKGVMEDQGTRVHDDVTMNYMVVDPGDAPWLMSTTVKRIDPELPLEVKNAVFLLLAAETAKTIQETYVFKSVRELVVDSFMAEWDGEEKTRPIPKIFIVFLSVVSCTRQDTRAPIYEMFPSLSQDGIEGWSWESEYIEGILNNDNEQFMTRAPLTAKIPSTIPTKQSGDLRAVVDSSGMIFDKWNRGLGDTPANDTPSDGITSETRPVIHNHYHFYIQ